MIAQTCTLMLLILLIIFSVVLLLFFPERNILLHPTGGASDYTIVFINSFDDISNNWGKTAQHASKEAHIFTDDVHPGMGKNKSEEMPLTMDSLITSLYKKLANEQKPLVLVAHDFGAIKALSYMHQYPQDVKGIVLVNPVNASLLTNFPLPNLSDFPPGALNDEQRNILLYFKMYTAAIARIEYSKLKDKNIVVIVDKRYEDDDNDVQKYYKNIIVIPKKLDHSLHITQSGQILKAIKSVAE